MNAWERKRAKQKIGDLPVGLVQFLRVKGKQGMSLEEFAKEAKEWKEVKANDLR